MTPLSLLLTLAVQQLAPGTPDPRLNPGPAESVYESAALEALVEAVSQANLRAPAALTSYSARVETELSFVRVEPDGRETVLQVEQVASDLAWRADGAMLMRLVGYRAQMLGASFSALSFFDVPWAVPSLYGERLDLVRTSGPEYAADGTLLVRRTLHPFAPGREAVYRFSGGETVLTLRLPDRNVPIARVRVEPVHMPERPTLLFHGDVDIDMTRMHIVSMQGRLFVSGRSRSLLDAFATGVMFVRFDSAEYDEAYWLPREQRFEVQAVSRLGEGRVVFRVASRFVEVEPNDPDATRLAGSQATHPSGLLEGRDIGLLSTFGDWRLPLGELNARSNAREFDVYAPPGLADTGAPRLTFGTRHFSQLLRVNDVEGLYTGAGLTFAFGEVAPGLRARVHAGWAWKEEAARGGAELEHRTGDWRTLLRAERQLAHTHDFLYAYEPEPDLPPLVAPEGFTFLDRRLASLGVRRLGEALDAQVELARVDDRLAGRARSPSLPPAEDGEEPAAPVDPLRAAVAGEYWRGRLELRRNPSASGLSLRPGLFLRGALEVTAGELSWQRAEVGAQLRRSFGRWTFSLGGDAGAVLGGTPAPQALFELGALADVPGSEGETFAGDRAALGRAGVMFRLPLLSGPVRVGSMWLPAPAPSPSVGFRMGWTDASPAARAVMEPLGWAPSEGTRSAVDVRLRFFGGGVSIGAARPLERGGEWRFVWGLVGAF